MASTEPPPHIGEIATYHMRQHASTVLEKLSKGTTVVFYMSISMADVRDGTVISNGRGMFTGPLRTGTRPEKDQLVQSLPGAPFALRSRLDRNEIEAIIIVKVDEKSGKGHYLILEMSTDDLRALEPRT
jgi:hypothetical protein